MYITLKDIAEKAQVSEATVSLALSRSNKVHPETERRITALAEEMGYVSRRRPRGGKQETASENAAEGAGQPHRNIAMLYLEMQSRTSPHEFFLQARVDAAQQYLSPRNCTLLMLGIPANCTYEMAANIFSQRPIDGIIVIAPVPQPLLDYLWERKIPVVHHHTLPALETVKWTSIASNSYGGTIAAVKYLASLGHKKIGFLSSPLVQPMLERRRGYEIGLLESGLPIRPEYYAIADTPNDENFKVGYEGMKRLLALRDRPTAVFVVADMFALDALQCCRDNGVDVPGDMSVVSFNDDPYARMAHPPLTTMRIDDFTGGCAAAQELFHAMTDPQYVRKKVVIPAHLVVRESTAPPRNAKG